MIVELKICLTDDVQTFNFPRKHKYKQMIHTDSIEINHVNRLTLKAPAKNASENVVCSTRLLHIFANIIDLCKCAK